jgi:glutathione S-transferase
VIRLHVFPTEWDFNPSPFCLKAETYCRLAKIPYEAVPTLPFKAPRGKLPFLGDGNANIPDSGLIIEHLKRRHGDPLDRDLDVAQRAQGHLIRRTVEESLYFVLVYARWLDPAGWRLTKPLFFGGVPPVLRDAVAALARRGVRRTLHFQGYGRHAPDEIYALGDADLEALATTIAAHRFAVVDRPTSYDATLYGVLANIIVAPMATPLSERARRHGALVEYVERMRTLLRTELSAAQ